MIHYDQLTPEQRRTSFGWFGEPWWSYVCYDEHGRLIEEMRKPFPSGESCLLCGQEFSDGDSGTATVAFTVNGASIRHIHKECQLMNVTGGLAHLDGRCSCHGGSTETPEMTLREEALEVWRRRHA